MKIEDMTITQIEEYIRDNFPDTNLYMRCLECDEYYPLNEMFDLDQEICLDCEKENHKYDDEDEE